jgi:hypothetical protein
LRTSILGTADWHCGSSLGLCPPEPIPIPTTGADYHPSSAQNWLWKGFIRQAEAARELADADKPEMRVLLLNGDLTDGGMHHGTVETLHPHPGTEAHVARRCFEEICLVWEPTHIFFVIGTPAHTGRGAPREIGLAKTAIDAGYPVVPAPTGDPAWSILLAKWGGVLHDVRHHGRMGRLPHTKESYQKNYAMQVHLAQALYKNGVEADMAWRAHMHQFADSGAVPPHRKGVRLISMPCWQMLGEYGRNRSIEEPTVFGHVYQLCDEGRPWDPIPLLHAPDPPTIWED